MFFPTSPVLCVSPRSQVLQPLGFLQSHAEPQLSDLEKSRKNAWFAGNVELILWYFCLKIEVGHELSGCMCFLPVIVRHTSRVLVF